MEVGWGHIFIKSIVGQCSGGMSIHLYTMAAGRQH